MLIIQDKDTGKWKDSPQGEAVHETRTQAKNAWIQRRMIEINKALQNVRTKRHK